jgi:hypothetical protein
MVPDTAYDNMRLFIALWPAPAARRALHAEQGRWRGLVGGYAIMLFFQHRPAGVQALEINAAPHRRAIGAGRSRCTLALPREPV